MKIRSILFVLFALTFSYVSAQRVLTISHYVFPEFQNGTIFMKDGTRIDIPLNYNSASEEIVFIRNGKKLALADEMIPNVDSVLIQNKKFILEDDTFIEIVSGINYDVLIAYKCKVSEPQPDGDYGVKSRTASIKTYYRALGPGGIYELTLPEDLIVRPYIEYQLKVDGQTHYFKSERQLLRLYSHKRDKIKEYTNNNKKIDIDNTASVTEFIQFIQID